MSAKIMTRLLWNGRGCVEQAKELLARDNPVELILPADFHHAIYRRLHPQPPETQAELLDIEGGPELLETISHIKQLDEIGDLMETVRETGTVVHVMSPAPRIILKHRTHPH